MRRGGLTVGAVVLCAALVGEPAIAAADAPPGSAPVEVAEDDRGSGVDWVEVVGWSLLAMGVGMELTYGGYVFPRVLALDSDPAMEEYRMMTPRGEDACARAERDPAAATVNDICNEADTLYVVGAVLLVGGLAAIVSGVAVLLLDEDPPEHAPARRVSLRAGFDGERADIALRLLF